MKYREMKKTKRFRSDLVKEGRALTKTAFELVLVFAVILFVFVFVFSVFFRVAGFTKKTADGTQYYSIVNTYNTDSVKAGDIVCVDIGRYVNCAEVLAVEGEQIILGTDKKNSVNCVLFNNVRYFSYEELREALGSIIVPEGYVLLKGDITSGESLSMGELVKKDIISGRAEFVFYPFSLFGRTADSIKM